MTWMLQDRLGQAVEGLTEMLPSTAQQFSDGVRQMWLNTDAQGSARSFGDDVMQDMETALGGREQAYKGFAGPSANFAKLADPLYDPMLDPGYRFDPRLNPDYVPRLSERDWLLQRMAALQKLAPETVGSLPINLAQFDGEVTARHRREREDLSASLARGDAPWTQMLGNMTGSLGWTDAALALVPMGSLAPLGVITAKSFAKFVAMQAAMGVIGEVPSVIGNQAIAQRLGVAPDNPVTTLAAGAAFGAAIGGVLGGAGKALEYFRTARLAEAATTPAGRNPLDHAADIDAAEAALRAGQAPPPPRLLKPDPALSADVDPAVDNILNLIFPLEASGFDTISQYSVIGTPRPLTQMSVDEVLAWQQVNITAGADSTAAGQIQIIHSTLTAIKAKLQLTGSEIFDPALQKRIAIELMKGRGLDDWRAGRISNEQFGNNLAGEWAALPEVSGPNAGNSHYGGDGLNAAGTTPEAVLAALNGEPVPEHLPRPGAGTGAGGTGMAEVTTPAGTRFHVTYQVIDASELRPATGDLQPRDRARAASADQVQGISARLDPVRLMPGPESDRGAPIIGPDRIIESGNGRVLAIVKAQTENPAAYASYVQAIRDRGYDVPAGMKTPVLVAVRQTPMDFTTRVRTIRESNMSTIARLSATEQAQFDTGYLSQHAFDAYQPGQRLAAPENAVFVRRMFSQMTEAERASMMDPGGALNLEGLRRIRSALFAQAFDAEDLLKLSAETESRGVASLIRMLEDLAPDWAAFRAMIDAGYVAREFDITEALMATVRIIARARSAGRDGQSVVAAIRDRLAQGDMFAASDPLTEAIIDVFYKGDRVRTPDASGEILHRYAASAAEMGRADRAQFAGTARAAPDEVLARAIAGHDGGTPYAPLPARAAAAPEVAADLTDPSAAGDPVPWAEGTASPAVQAADDAALKSIAEHGASVAPGSIEELKSLVAVGASRAAPPVPALKLPPVSRVQAIVDRGDEVSTALEGMTAKERKWLTSEYAAGRLEKERDWRMGGRERYRRPVEGSDARWQRTEAAAPLEITFDTGSGTVTRNVAEVVSDLDAEHKLEMVLDACRTARGAR